MSNHKQDGSISNQTWGGRFSAAPADTLAAYTESQSFDRRLYAQDIRASQAHARMLARQGIISAKEADILVDGLSRILGEIESGSFVWKSDLEDVHMNIEARLVDIAGETGKKLHTGRSRNDQVGLTFRLYVAEQCEAWIDACVALCTGICEKARESQDIILPGFTHLQPAQPVSLAHHLLAYAAMLRRDTERLADSLKRTKISPLGAAALAGSTYPLDPTGVAAEVGFPNIYSNSMDAVSDRDFVLESLFCASVIMAHLSRFCEEIIIWASPAFGFIYLPDAYSTGSSIMPQKKNPDVAELMRGKCGRVYGHLMAMLTIIKGLPLSYNRDLQEDKEGFFDTDTTVMMSLGIMADMLSALRFNKQGMLDACKKGFLNATELADYLATKGMPFREAHHIAGKAVALAEGEGRGLEDLPLDALRTLSPIIDEDIYDVLDYQACVRRRETPGGTGPKSVSQQILNLECWLKEMKNGAISK